MEISNLQRTDSKTWSGVTSKNHLGAIWQQKPQVASNLIGRMLAQSYGTSLDNMMSELPVKELDSDDDFTWELMGQSDQNIELLEARMGGSVIVESDLNVGAGRQKFELVFPKRWFAPTDVIVGHLNEQYPIQIEDEYQEGNNTVYECVAYGANTVKSGIPGEELVNGKSFSKEYSPVEESFSVRGGETNFASPTKFRNTFSRIRKQYTVPGNMVNRKMVGTFDMVDSAGKTKKFTTWMQLQVYQFEHQISQEKNKLLFFGRSTVNEKGDLSNNGKSGQGIRAGFGIREQMEVANTHYYTKFDYDLITNILTELAEGKLGMPERKFVLRTGERGATLVHKAIRQEASGWTPLQDTDAQKKTTSKLHPNSRQWGYQYTEFIAPNNIYVRVETDPLYSDPVRNKVRAPNNGHFTGGLAESYRMDIFDIGTNDGEPNLQKVVSKEDSDVSVYINGLRSAFSPSGERAASAASSVDGFEYHRMLICGAMLKDPTRTATLIPAFTY